MKYLILALSFFAAPLFAHADTVPSYVEDGAERLKSFGLKDQEAAIIYDYDNHLLHLIHFENGSLKIDQSFLGSGGRGGVSNRIGSGATAPGIHKIYKMQGESYPVYQTFDAYKYGYRETILPPTRGFQDWKSDFIMTRVMRLQGLEKNMNNNSVVRNILIHSTPEEGMLGYDESAGCIRIANQEIVTLFNQVREGSLVNVVSTQGKPKRVPNTVRIPMDESQVPELIRL